MDLEKKLQPIIEKAIEAAEKTGDFVIEQAPLVLQEFYAWHLAEHIFYLIIGLFLSSLIFIAKPFIPYEEDKRWTMNFLGKQVEQDYAIPAYVFGGGAFVVGVIMFFINLLIVTKIIIAPRLYLIEYFMK